jgi:SH3-like domain-containing protein
METVKQIINMLWRGVVYVARSVVQLVRWWLGKIQNSSSRGASVVWLLGGLVVACIACSFGSSIFSPSDTSQEAAVTPTAQAIVQATSEPAEEIESTATPDSTDTPVPTDTPQPPTAEPTAIPTETATSTPTPHPTATRTRQPTATAVPQVKVNVSSANIRSGPGANYDAISLVEDGETLDVIATNTDGDWYNVSLSDGSLGWIAVNVVGSLPTSSNIRIAQTIPAPPTLAATSAAQATNTAVPVATNTPAPLATSTLSSPTQVPEPTQPPAPSPGNVVIIGVNKQAEYVDIQNVGGTDQDLTNWRLVSETGNQACTLGGVLAAGQVLRIYARAEDAGLGGFNCGFGGPIWNNSESDPAVLYDANGNEVSRR